MGITQQKTANSPESLGVTPEYLLQYHAVSRSIQNLSANAKKLTAMAMSLLPFDLSSRTATFTLPQFCKALGVEYGGKTKKLLKEAVKECMQSAITIEMPDKKWKMFTWFSTAECDEKTGVCAMTFSEELAATLLEFKKMYAKIKLTDFGRLQSKYALRLFEFAVSFSSLAGKNGNPADSWYYEYSIAELRTMLAVPDDAYLETFRFRQKVIEEPIREINLAGVGITITAEAIKQGRNLNGLRFICKKVNHTAHVKGKAPLELPEPSPKTAEQREEKELQHLKTLYPQEFALIYAEKLGLARKPYMTESAAMRVAEAQALSALKEKYGIVK